MSALGYFVQKFVALFNRSRGNNGVQQMQNAFSCPQLNFSAVAHELYDAVTARKTPSATLRQFAP